MRRPVSIRQSVAYTISHVLTITNTKSVIDPGHRGLADPNANNVTDANRIV